MIENLSLEDKRDNKRKPVSQQGSINPLTDCFFHFSKVTRYRYNQIFITFCLLDIQKTIV